ncbi:MAG TPA: hypothetical protein VF245_05865 [Solirubrobacterales bacterium]
MLLDGSFHGLDAVGALLAFAVLATAADEVFVKPAFALGPVVDQASAALAAVDAATQVMEVPPGTFAADLLGAQQVLDLLKRGLVHQRFVASLVDLAAVGNLAQVVDVPQERLQVLGLEHPRWVLAGWAGAQAALLHDGGQLGERVVAAGVEREGFADQRGALRVKYDGADFAAVHHQAVMQVADGGAVRGAAALGLLGRALHDLSRQVAAVELSDGRHDAVQQQARGRLVNVLGDGDELRPRFLDRHDDLHIVGAIAGQAVNLVDDHVVDIAAL